MFYVFVFKINIFKKNYLQDRGCSHEEPADLGLHCFQSMVNYFVKVRCAVGLLGQIQHDHIVAFKMNTI